jgi:hypothetical protein
MTKPVFVVKNIEIVEKILNTKAECFANCPGSYLDDALSNEVFHRSLSSLQNDEWRAGRTVL